MEHEEDGALGAPVPRPPRRLRLPRRARLLRRPRSLRRPQTPRVALDAVGLLEQEVDGAQGAQSAAARVLAPPPGAEVGAEVAGVV